MPDKLFYRIRLALTIIVLIGTIKACYDIAKLDPLGKRIGDSIKRMKKDQEKQNCD